MAVSSGGVRCEEFMEFQELCKVMRRIEDRIAHHLNTRVPTASFAEKLMPAKPVNNFMSLRWQLMKVGTVIKNCIAQISSALKNL